MQRRRYNTLVQCQHCLQQPSHPGRRFKMADIGFDRTDRQRRRRRRAERAPDGGGFDRIAHRRPGAVHLEKGKVVRRNTCISIYRAQQCRLRRLARQRQSDRAAIRTEPVARITARIGSWSASASASGLMITTPAALAANIAVGAFVEGKAAAAPRQHRCPAKTEKWVGRQQQVDPADDRA